jgi:hypothetical protein
MVYFLKGIYLNFFLFFFIFFLFFFIFFYFFFIFFYFLKYQCFLYVYTRVYIARLAFTLIYAVSLQANAISLRCSNYVRD